MTNQPNKLTPIEQAITVVQSKYKIGRTILEQCGPKSAEGEIARLAEKYQINRDTAQKLRAMAMWGTGYTQKELDEQKKIHKLHDALVADTGEFNFEMQLFLI